MPSNLIRSVTATSVPNGEVIIPFFAPNGSQGFTFFNPYWYMENGWESIGATEDEMTFRVQAQNVNNYSFDIVMNPNGPLQTIRFDTPVLGVRYYAGSDSQTYYEVAWAGFVKTIRQKSDSGSQFVQVTCTSVKKLLRDQLVRGSYCWDGASVTYRDAVPLHMNRNGRPDWTFSDDKIPMPAVNPDWGLESDEAPPDAAEQDSTAACYCTLGMLLRYLICCYSASGTTSESFEVARDGARQYFTGLTRLPTAFPFNIIWPDTFGQEVDQFVVGNFNNAVGQNNTNQGGARKGRDVRFRNGQPLVGNVAEMGVLDTIFAECGSYSYALSYGGIEDNDDGLIDVYLNCVPTRLIDASQALPLYYAGGDETQITAPVVRDIDYVESNAGTYTRMSGIGSSVKIEQRNSSEDSSIKYGFSMTDFDAWRKDSVIGSGPTASTDERLMYKALKKYPHILSRFVLNPLNDPQDGTYFDGYPLAKAPRPVWPFLLSYQGAEVTTQANDIVPYPVRIEVDTAGDGIFRDSQIEADGFISWDNGYFEFLTLRDVGINRNDQPSLNGGNGRKGIFTWNNGWGVVDENGLLDVTLNNIRVTVAVPMDATLNCAMKTPADKAQIDDTTLYQQAPDSPDAIRFDTRFTRPMIIDLSRLYDLWLRSDSWPVPESAGGTQATDKLTIDDAVRSDKTLLVQNVTKSLYERNRLQRSGYFKFIGPLLPPQVYALGQQLLDISSIDPESTVNPFPLNCCIQMRKWATRNMGAPMMPKWTSSTELVPI